MYCHGGCIQSEIVSECNLQEFPVPFAMIIEQRVHVDVSEENFANTYVTTNLARVSLQFYPAPSKAYPYRLNIRTSFIELSRTFIYDSSNQTLSRDSSLSLSIGNIPVYKRFVE